MKNKLIAIGDLATGQHLKTAGSTGGKRKGSGRKKLNTELETVRITVRVTEKQKATFDAIKGPEWLRHQLDRIGQDHS